MLSTQGNKEAVGSDCDIRSDSGIKKHHDAGGKLRPSNMDNYNDSFNQDSGFLQDKPSTMKN